jgi:choline transport protein
MNYHSFPIFEVWLQAVSSPAAAIVFLAILAACGSFAVLGCFQTASRLTWCFARDDALVGSPLLRRIHPRLGVPVWALSANCAIVSVLGCIYLGSTSAFNALLGAGLILQQLSFGIPAALILGYRFRGKEAVDRALASSSSSSHGESQRGKFRLPSAVGWAANTLTVVHGVVALVFYSLPAQLPATGGNMSTVVIPAPGWMVLLDNKS